MQITATAKSVRISPRKVRFVADAIRRKSLEEALKTLVFTEKRSGLALTKVIKSAVANATHNGNLAPENLVIESITVTEGQALKRYHPSTRGRVHPYTKQSSHIRVTLTEKKVAAPVATKPVVVKEPKVKKEEKGATKK